MRSKLVAMQPGNSLNRSIYVEFMIFNWEEISFCQFSVKSGARGDSEDVTLQFLTFSESSEQTFIGIWPMSFVVLGQIYSKNIWNKT